MRSRTFLILIFALLITGGCTTVSETYRDTPIDQLWVAMKSAANEPRYDDWHIRENEVWVDEEQKRIEVYRRLHRQLVDPVTKSRHEEQTWKFQIWLEESDPPKITFISRDWAVPAKAQLEGDRYFKDVWDLLSGAPSEGRLSVDFYDFWAAHWKIYVPNRADPDNLFDWSLLAQAPIDDDNGNVINFRDVLFLPYVPIVLASDENVISFQAELPFY